MKKVRFAPESGHSEDGRKESAFDPKQTIGGLKDSVRDCAENKGVR